MYSEIARLNCVCFQTAGIKLVYIRLHRGCSHTYAVIPLAVPPFAAALLHSNTRPVLIYGGECLIGNIGDTAAKRHFRWCAYNSPALGSRWEASGISGSPLASLIACIRAL